MLGAGDGFMSRPAEGLARRRGLADRPEVRQRLRRLRRVAPRLHAGLSLAGRSCSSSSSAASSARPCARTRRWSRSTGRPTATGEWPQMRVFAFDHRMQLEAMAGRDARRRSARSSSSASRPRCRWRDGQPGYGILCDSRLGRDALYAAAGTGLWIGRPVEWPGSRPLTLEPELGPDFGGLGGMAARARRQGALLLPPRRRRRDEGASRRRRCCGCSQAARRNRLEFLLEIIPSKVGPVDDETTAKVIQPLLRHRRLSRLVEARADDDRRRLDERLRGDRRATTRIRAASWCSASTRRRASSQASFAARRPASAGEGLRRRPHDLRRRCRETGWRARSATTRRSRRWRERYAACAASGTRRGLRGGKIA